MSSLKGFRFFGLFHLFYTLFLVASALYNWAFEDLYASLFFYFHAPHEDFLLWFPRYHLPLFIIAKAIKCSLAISPFVTLLLAIRYRNRLSAAIAYNPRRDFSGLILSEVALTLVGLTYCLVLYGLARMTIGTSAFENIQVLIARGFLLQLCLQIFSVCVSHWKQIQAHLKEYLLAPQLPYNISLLRVLFFCYLIYIYWKLQIHATAMMGMEQRVPLPGIGWLIDALPLSPSIYLWITRIGMLVCLMIALGFRTRFFLILNSLLCFYILAAPNFFGKLWHQQIVIWISWFFTFSRCYDVLSIDALLNRKSVVRSADYTFPIRFIWIQLGIIYFWAGFYKLWDSGFHWALGPSMIHQVQLEWLQNYDRTPAIRIDQWPLLLHIGGLAVILFELAFLFLVLKPRLRFIAAIGGLVMHNLIGYFMYISFSMMLQAFYVFFVDFNRLFAGKKAFVRALVSPFYSRMAFGVGLSILFCNFVLGMLSIDSYPFSAYPKYSALIPDTVKIMKWEVYLKNGSVVDAHIVGLENNFRWEDYGWLEHELIRDFESGIEVQGRIEAYWDIWVNGNAQLSDFDSVAVKLVVRPVAPQKEYAHREVAKMSTLAGTRF